MNEKYSELRSGALIGIWKIIKNYSENLYDKFINLNNNTLITISDEIR